MATSQWYTKTKVDQLLANAGGGTTDYNALTNKPTLGSAAAQNTSAFDSAGAASAIATAAAATYVAFRGTFSTNTFYPKNSLIIQSGFVYLAVTDVPSRTVFTVADWQVLSGTSSGTPAGITTTNNGDGFFTITGTGASDNGDGFSTLSDSTVTDNGDGYVALAA